MNCLIKSSIGFELPVLSWRSDLGFLAQDQIEQRFENTSPTLAFARCASGIAYEQPAGYQRLDAPGELVRENIQRIQTRIAKSAHLLQCDRRLGQTNLRDP